MQKKYINMCILLIAFIVFMLWENKKFYCLNYFRPLGISKNSSYNDVVKIKGSPLTISEKDGIYNVIYDDLIFVTHNLSNSGFIRLEITGKDIRFGRLKLGIGSSREDIEKAYIKVPHISDLCPNEFGVIDGLGINYEVNPWIVFVFDADNVVEKVLIFFGP